MRSHCLLLASVALCLWFAGCSDDGGNASSSSSGSGAGTSAGGAGGESASSSTGGGAGGEGACVPGAIEDCYSGPPLTVDVGICKAGTRTCNAAGTGFGPCEGEVLPAAADNCATPEDEDCSGENGICTGATV